jgi:hypothetical protein
VLDARTTTNAVSHQAKLLIKRFIRLALTARVFGATSTNRSVTAGVRYNSKVSPRSC